MITALDRLWVERGVRWPGNVVLLQSRTNAVDQKMFFRRALFSFGVSREIRNSDTAKSADLCGWGARSKWDCLANYGERSLERFALVKFFLGMALPALPASMQSRGCLNIYPFLETPISELVLFSFQKKIEVDLIPRQDRVYNTG